MVARKKNPQQLTNNKYFKFPFIFQGSQSPKNSINPNFQKIKREYFNAIKKKVNKILKIVNKFSEVFKEKKKEKKIVEKYVKGVFHFSPINYL